MKKDKWKRGGGTFVGYAVCMILLVSFIIYLIGFFLLARTINQMENAVNMIARDVVVCESLEEAQAVSERQAKEYLKSYEITIKRDADGNALDESIQTSIEYASGSDREWEKGNYIVVTLIVDLDSNMPMISGTKRVKTMVMIE